MYRRKRKGQAIVEMALVFPFFLLIVIGGLIDFGFAFYNFLTLQQLANDTAQWAADNNATDGEISDYVNNRKPDWWSGVFTVHPVEPTILVTGGETVNVLLSYESPAYTPFYQTMLQATTGHTSVRLATLAAYKKPELIKDH